MTNSEKAADCHRRVEEIREIAKGIYAYEERRAVLQMAEEFKRLSLREMGQSVAVAAR
jgi:hypothetical protein